MARKRVQGCSQPSRVSFSFHSRRQIRVAGLVQINRQHRADDRARVISLAKRLRAAEHQKTAAALGDKPLQQHHLIVREKIRLHVAQNDRVILEKFRGGDRESRRAIRTRPCVFSRMSTGWS